MVDINTQARIQEVFRRENRSFLQYIRQSSPWAGFAEKAMLDKLNQLADEELGAVEALALWMESKNISLPYLGAFASKFSSYNFMDVRKLLKPLIAEQKKELADLEADAKALTGEAEKQVAALVELNRKHLALLESWA